jgi:hypothetical protein
MDEKTFIALCSLSQSSCDKGGREKEKKLRKRK